MNAVQCVDAVLEKVKRASAHWISRTRVHTSVGDGVRCQLGFSCNHRGRHLPAWPFAAKLKPRCALPSKASRTNTNAVACRPAISFNEVEDGCIWIDYDGTSVLIWPRVGNLLTPKIWRQDTLRNGWNWVKFVGDCTLEVRQGWYRRNRCHWD